MQQCIKIFIILYLYEAQHVSGNTPPIIRSLKLHWQPLVFHTWKVVGRCPQSTRPTTSHVQKTRGCQCSFRLLIMGGMSPETCWASYKYGTIKFWYIVASCWIFLYELNLHFLSCNARTSEMKVTTLVQWQVRYPLLLEATQVANLVTQFLNNRVLKNTYKECKSSHIFVVFMTGDKVFYMYRRYPELTRTLILSKLHITITAHNHCSTVVSY
jgi:hypothetical protein